MARKDRKRKETEEFQKKVKNNDKDDKRNIVIDEPCRVKWYSWKQND